MAQAPSAERGTTGRLEDAMDKLLLTPEDAARALSIGRSKVYELLRGGQLDSVLIGASRRIPTEALLAFVAAQRRPAS